jgi:SulP family sulfate permease
MANTATGFIGGMAGCAMIGQSMINVKSGGRGPAVDLRRRRVPAVPDGGAGRLGGADPDAGAGGDHDHGVDRHLQLVVDQEPARPSALLLHRHAGDRGAVVYTHNLAIGVLVGVLLSGIFFAGKIAQLLPRDLDAQRRRAARTYVVEGQVFFASADAFTAPSTSRRCSSEWSRSTSAAPISGTSRRCRRWTWRC